MKSDHFIVDSQYSDDPNQIDNLISNDNTNSNFNGLIDEFSNDDKPNQNFQNSKNQGGFGLPPRNIRQYSAKKEKKSG